MPSREGSQWGGQTQTWLQWIWKVNKNYTVSHKFRFSCSKNVSSVQRGGGFTCVKKERTDKAWFIWKGQKEQLWWTILFNDQWLCNWYEMTNGLFLIQICWLSPLHPKARFTSTFNSTSTFKSSKGLFLKYFSTNICLAFQIRNPTCKSKKTTYLDFCSRENAAYWNEEKSQTIKTCKAAPIYLHAWKHPQDLVYPKRSLIWGIQCERKSN